MALKIHSFHESKLRSFEKEIDQVFINNGFKIIEATREEQKKGFDRYLVKNKKRKLKAEYKSDLRMYDTGNFFIETLSVDTTGKLGWALTSEADILVYYMLNDNELWIIDMNLIKSNIADWTKQYKKKKCWNYGYNSEGLLLPKEIIASLVKKKFSII